MVFVPLNQDISFIGKGQDSEIKVCTFTFTKHGVAYGAVQSISEGTIEDEKCEPLCIVRIYLREKALKVARNNMPLSAGMGVCAEVKTNKLKGIKFFISPLGQIHGRKFIGTMVVGTEQWGIE